MTRLVLALTVLVAINGIAGAAVPADLDAKIASVTMSAGAAVEQGFKRFMQMPAMANILKPETVNEVATAFREAIQTRGKAVLIEAHQRTTQWLKEHNERTETYIERAFSDFLDRVARRFGAN